MKRFWNDNKEKIRIFIICGTIFIAVLSIISVISGAIMRLFGFQYKSVGSIVLFFIIATALSFPLNLIAGGLPKALYELGRISKKVALILYLILDTVATSFGLEKMIIPKISSWTNSNAAFKTLDYAHRSLLAYKE